MAEDEFADLIEAIKRSEHIKNWFVIIGQMPASMRNIELRKIGLELKQQGVASAVLDKLDLLNEEDSFSQVAKNLE
ncbi:MAG: hypothetical protein OEZ47_02635 [Gammaproteobacteria bacterium]|nr:hypothetical protein [Gammaproteobacteria bacterium]